MKASCLHAEGNYFYFKRQRFSDLLGDEASYPAPLAVDNGNLHCIPSCTWETKNHATDTPVSTGHSTFVVNIPESYFFNCLPIIDYFIILILLYF